MNFSESLDEFIERGAEKYEIEFHNKYPEGMTVANYCNSDVPWNCFDAGANSLKPIVLKLYDALTKCDCLCYDVRILTLKDICNRCESLTEVSQMLEGGGK